MTRRVFLGFFPLVVIVGAAHGSIMFCALISIIWPVIVIFVALVEICVLKCKKYL